MFHTSYFKDSYKDFKSALESYDKNFNEKGLAKVKFGVGVGKKKYDKRESIKQREWSRKKERLLRK